MEIFPLWSEPTGIKTHSCKPTAWHWSLRYAQRLGHWSGKPRIYIQGRSSVPNGSVGDNQPSPYTPQTTTISNTTEVFQVSTHEITISKTKKTHPKISLVLNLPTSFLFLCPALGRKPPLRVQRHPMGQKPLLTGSAGDQSYAVPSTQISLCKPICRGFLHKFSCIA